MPKHRSARQMDAAAPLAIAVGPQVEDRSSAAGRWILFALFAASGFAGLIYESIWTHYLKLFLGHAAYAQALVLAIFMGGMALGSWLAARWSGRLRNLLLAYAVTEAAVAAFALVFHEVFVSSTGWAHESVLPHFAGFKWVLSTALILPQCVLLGMTFPLMTAGVLRSYPERPGRSISLLYFTNSLGAAIGVLVSGFILVRILGLPGTIRLAGAINLLVAGAVFLLARGRPAAPPQRGAKEAPRDRAILFFLAVALITGASSFIYEVAWIRMLSLVLGTSTHSFELMLSAFILGLSLGGLWIQRRIDSLLAPVRTLGFLQLEMGVLALLSLPLYAKTFDVMRWLTNALERSDAGYAWFILSSNGIALAIMLPATFCAGTTLPLVTFHLMRRGHGESSIGAVYAANTVGAIAAVFFAVHFGLPALRRRRRVRRGRPRDARYRRGRRRERPRHRRPGHQGRRSRPGRLRRRRPGRTRKRRDGVRAGPDHRGGRTFPRRDQPRHPEALQRDQVLLREGADPEPSPLREGDRAVPDRRRGPHRRGAGAADHDVQRTGGELHDQPRAPLGVSG